jgi:hypothetical protein
MPIFSRYQKDHNILSFVIICQFFYQESLEIIGIILKCFGIWDLWMWEISSHRPELTPLSSLFRKKERGGNFKGIYVLSKTFSAIQPHRGDISVTKGVTLCSEAFFDHRSLTKVIAQEQPLVKRHKQNRRRHKCLKGGWPVIRRNGIMFGQERRHRISHDTKIPPHGHELTPLSSLFWGKREEGIAKGYMYCRRLF